MRSSLRLVLVCLLSLSAGCSTVKGWFSDDDVDPREPVELQKIDEQVKLKSRWSRGVGDGQGEGRYKINPVLIDDTLYVASAEGEVAAVDSAAGRVRWKRDLDLAVSGGVGHHGNSLFLGASEGLVMRLSADGGDEIWRTAVSGEVLSAPQGDGRYVVAQTYDGKLMGFDYETGEVRWTYTSDVPVLTLRGTGTPMIMGDNAIAGFADGKVVAINLRSGNVAWESRVAIPQGTSEIERIVDIDGSMA
ncbi:MAG: PQQ-binding-like beta-propeller repeat protein, partial [Halieaceae bacterium]